MQQRRAVPARVLLDRGGVPVDVRAERVLRVAAALALEDPRVADAVDHVVRRHRAGVALRPAVVGEAEPGDRLDVPAERVEPGEHAVRAGGVAAGLVRQRLRQHGQHRLGAGGVARPGGAGRRRSSRRAPRGAGRPRWPRSPARRCRPGAAPGRGRRAARPAAVDAGGQRPGRRLAQLERGRAPRGDGGLGRRVVVRVRREPGPEAALVQDPGHHGKRVRQPVRDPGQLALEPVVGGRAQVDLRVELLELLVPAGPAPPLEVVPEPLHLRVPGGAQRGEHDPGLAGVARTRVDQPGGRLGRLARPHRPGPRGAGAPRGR